jgi:hypothetical protein
MLRELAALYISLVGPTPVQSPAGRHEQAAAIPEGTEETPPPCDSLYLLYFPAGSAALGPRQEAIAEIFAGTHARPGTRNRIVARLGFDGSIRARRALARRRIEAVKAVLARFNMPRGLITVEFEEAAEPDLRDTISLIEVVPSREMARRRAAWPANIAC